VTALTLRHSQREHEFHRDMHNITEQTERLAIMLLLLFGGALVNGLLAPLTWSDAFAAVAILVVVRPGTGLIGLKASLTGKFTMAFFGIRGSDLSTTWPTG
jgi:hypothetical protein